ncbi:MAG: TetR/AcrR family transcriptional regulator [Acidimicrobiales bacterium]
MGAALEEFLERGWAGATIERMAARAGVSRPTVFAVGSKSTLFRLARDRAIVGDEDARPIAQRPNFDQVAAAAGPEEALRCFASVSADIVRRFASLNDVLRQGAATDPELAQLWRISEQERLDGARVVIRIVTAKGDLRPGLAPVTDILWLLMAPDHYHRLVVERSWNHRRYESWYAETMVRLLLP